MSESKLKAAAMDSVGELPNLLLREGGYPHLPMVPTKKAHVTNIWMEEKDYRGCNGIRIDFSNDYHIRVVIDGFSPEAIARAFQQAAIFINNADRSDVLKVQP